MKNTQETIVNYLKNYGFIYPSSEIYNGLANAWDYGPLGSLLKNNLKQALLKHFVFTKANMVLVDTSIILNANVWKASGHLDNFSDPLIDCKKCQSRYRVDKLLNEKLNVNTAENTSLNEFEEIIAKNRILCPTCNSFDWTNVRQFNLMFKTYQGVTENQLNTLYLRPETAQGIFINFKNIVRSQRMKIPFGVAQIGKAFRNEITPGNFIFRTREFEQMEIEFFVQEKDAANYFEYFKKEIDGFLTEVLKIKPENKQVYEHPREELSHYSKRTIDYQFNFPHGFSELWGLANRSNYDLGVHQNFSTKKLTYLDPQTNEEYLPYVIEPSVGIERLFYALICNAYEVQKIDENDSREILRIPHQVAPYQIAVFPLVNKLNQKAKEVYEDLLKQNYRIIFDSSGSIGKRYRRMDAIGTPYCITIDFETIEKQTVTIRDRDSMQQIKIQLKDLNKILEEKLK
ncbi:glycine--tRNA ligase [[Mycoplasma] testudinis]|uniref:glycine--tRNA ligase n=1 Tax=[Mycoplasma] testudinis TaxID=33924 RepID=UPI0004877454|nr:glycine--tRNA ligase [[Mycoplasma] testudinis]